MRFRKGQVVEVEFLDHVEDSSTPLLFTLYGRIVKVDRKYLVVESWSYTDRDGDDGDTNVKTWTIVRSTITQAWRLVRTT